MDSREDDTNRRGPLTGLKVLDLTDEKADFCSKLLADLGAEVIRVEPPVAHRQGGRHWNNLFEILPCKDGFIHLTHLQRWDTLVDWLDAEGMAEDLKNDEWSDEAYRIARVDHVVDVLQKWTRTHTAGELFQLGQLRTFLAAGTPCGGGSWGSSPGSATLYRKSIHRCCFSPETSQSGVGCSQRYPGAGFYAGIGRSLCHTNTGGFRRPGNQGAVKETCHRSGR